MIVINKGTLFFKIYNDLKNEETYGERNVLEEEIGVMRRMWSAVLAAALAVSLTACSASKPAEQPAPETTEQAMEAQTEAGATEVSEADEAAESAEARTGGAAGGTQEILVAAAASLQYVMEDEIKPAFEKANPDVKLQFTFDSSGKLQTQIEEGADADVFFSAAKKQMNALMDEDMIDKDSVVELLENKITLIVPKGSELGIFFPGVPFMG